MSEYAKNTKVPVSKSKTELESIFKRWGVDGFMLAWENGYDVIAFKYRGLQARIPVPQPQRADFYTAVAYEQALRQRWRAIILFIKSTLEAVDSGIVSFEQAFLPHLVLPDGRTVTDSLMPGIYVALEAGQIPPMLPEGRQT